MFLEFVKDKKLNSAFTLVEMLMALLIVSVILSAVMPVITSRTKTDSRSYSKYSPMPIGAIIMWKADGALPDITWLEANGQAIPAGIEYEECRKIYGPRLPDLRGADREFYNIMNTYLSNDIKDYILAAIKPLPNDSIIIWGTTAAIPEGWSEAAEYRGVFLRGYGSITHTKNNGSTVGNTATTHSSGAIGAVQGDSVRNLQGSFGSGVLRMMYGNTNEMPSNLFITSGTTDFATLANGGRTSRAVTHIDASRIVPTSNEIRPINKAVRYIKYTNPGVMPNLPAPPQYAEKFRYIVKVRK